MSRYARVAALTAVLVCAICSVALADGPAGADPQSNFPVTTLPSVCDQPVSAPCLDASVGFLNQARANLGQGPYLLPSNFDALTPQVQLFVLANLDRQLYNLPPITGITAALSQDALGGVRNDNDPRPADANFDYWTANWAGGFQNAVLAYEAWMYDDGPGSGNLDCTARNTQGCWGHRQDVLWSFTGSGPLAMGTAAANDPSGTPGYAMLLGMGEPDLFKPTYTYTWSQAVANGAGSASSGTGSGSGSTGSGSGSAGSGSGASPRRVPLTVTVHGPGAVSDQSGHRCAEATCTFAETVGTHVRLVAQVAGRGSFSGWLGGCHGATTQCTVTIGDTPATVAAGFVPPARISRTAGTPRHPSVAHSSGRWALVHPRARRGRRAVAHGARHRISTSVRVHGATIAVLIAAPAHASLQCSLTRRTGRRYGGDRFQPCWVSTIYPKVHRGRYRLRVRVAGHVLTLYVRAR